MPALLVITLIVLSIFGISIYLAHEIQKVSRLAGVAVGMTGILLGIVLIVDYFEQVPFPIFVVSLAAVCASLVYALFEAVRNDTTQDSS
jgi:hypothetical protein